MNFKLQIFGDNLELFSDLLGKISNKLKKGETSGNHFEENCYYNYSLEEESYHRKFMIYSIDNTSIPPTDPKILGIAFGNSHHEAFEGFTQSENGKKKLLSNPTGSITIREVIGDPIYKDALEIFND
jgi:hypothetical protein